MVNTASRVAVGGEPGSAFVGEATRRATEQAIVYEDAGSFELKGKEEGSQLWPALLVSAWAASFAREGLRAPFVAVTVSFGRSGPFHIVRTSGRRSARLGDGDSRHWGSPGWLWEFYKHFDGMSAARLLAPGSLSRVWGGGDVLGVGGHGADAPSGRGRTIRRWARQSCRGSGGARSRCRGVAIVEPRLAQLLVWVIAAGTTGRICSPRGGCSSSGWSTSYPTVLAFEDMEWADVRLLDFVEYLLEVVVRPASLRRDPCSPGAARATSDWGAGHRISRLCIWSRF